MMYDNGEAVLFEYDPDDQSKENATDTFYPPNFYSFTVYNVFTHERNFDILSP